MTTQAKQATSTPLDLAQFDGHTPGPWSVQDEKASRGAQQMRIWTIADGHRQLFALNCTALSEESQVENRKSSELAAAAPALLAECRRQREIIETAYKWLDRAGEKAAGEYLSQVRRNA